MANSSQQVPQGIMFCPNPHLANKKRNRKGKKEKEKQAWVQEYYSLRNALFFWAQARPAAGHEAVVFDPLPVLGTAETDFSCCIVGLSICLDSSGESDTQAIAPIDLTMGIWLSKMGFAATGGCAAAIIAPAAFGRPACDTAFDVCCICGRCCWWWWWCCW